MSRNVTKRAVPGGLSYRRDQARPGERHHAAGPHVSPLTSAATKRRALVMSSLLGVTRCGGNDSAPATKAVLVFPLGAHRARSLGLRSIAARLRAGKKLNRMRPVFDLLDLSHHSAGSERANRIDSLIGSDRHQHTQSCDYLAGPESVTSRVELGGGYVFRRSRPTRACRPGDVPLSLRRSTMLTTPKSDSAHSCKCDENNLAPSSATNGYRCVSRPTFATLPSPLARSASAQSKTVRDVSARQRNLTTGLNESNCVSRGESNPEALGSIAS